MLAEQSTAVDPIFKICFFVAASTMPQKQKDAWIDVLPLFSEEQAERLAAIFEARFVEDMTTAVDAAFALKLEKVMTSLAPREHRAELSHHDQAALLHELKAAYQELVTTVREQQAALKDPKAKDRAAAQKILESL